VGNWRKNNASGGHGKEERITPKKHEPGPLGQNDPETEMNLPKRIRLSERFGHIIWGMVLILKGRPLSKQVGGMVAGVFWGWGGFFANGQK